MGVVPTAILGHGGLALMLTLFYNIQVHEFNYRNLQPV